MNIEINSDIIVNGLTPLKTVISEKTLIPILECVKIECHDGALYFTGDNSEVNCVNIIEAGLFDKFSFCVKYSTFMVLVNNLSSQLLHLTIKEGEILVKHRNGDFKLPTFATEDFPKPRTETMIGAAKVKGEDIKRSLKIANKFTLNNEMEPMANISISIGKRIVIRSTNKSTLFKETLKGKGDEALLLISGKASSALVDLLDDKKVQINYSGNLVTLVSDSFEMTIVQQEGEFPIAMFDRIADDAHEGKPLKVKQKDLLEALKRLAVITNAATNKVKFTLSKKKLLITSNNELQSTRAHEIVKAKFKGKTELGYNLRFLVEVLNVIGEDIDFEIAENGLLYMRNEKKIGIVSPMLLDKE